MANDPQKTVVDESKILIRQPQNNIQPQFDQMQNNQTLITALNEECNALVGHEFFERHDSSNGESKKKSD
ncbi:MAG: hypothetical protein LBU77_03550 [Clostridiales bacterium]|jgi:hypothetical protein|nr:hypothetical protein [Clostridiales bacterium]